MIVCGAVLLFVLALVRCVSLVKQHDSQCSNANRIWRQSDFSLWRYAILLLPAAFSGLLLYLPIETWANEKQRPLRVDLLELDIACHSTEKRDYFEGRMCQVRGMVWPESDRHITLFKLKEDGAVRISVYFPDNLAGEFQPRDWVEVTGAVRFRKLPHAGDYIATMELAKNSDALPVNPDYTDLVSKPR
jgi:hypothetical protein